MHFPAVSIRGEEKKEHSTILCMHTWEKENRTRTNNGSSFREERKLGCDIKRKADKLGQHGTSLWGGPPGFPRQTLTYQKPSREKNET